ncbi:hypothetical protein Dip518_000015 [Parelusimicrobium proximum]|uniref:hypothetical protein n=1 Tax=Parelusimicrobium proximum TaxID=3228953 RepID=UPI003D1858BF
MKNKILIIILAAVALTITLSPVFARESKNTELRTTFADNFNKTLFEKTKDRQASLLDSKKPQNLTVDSWLDMMDNGTKNAAFNMLLIIKDEAYFTPVDPSYDEERAAESNREFAALLFELPRLQVQEWERDLIISFLKEKLIASFKNKKAEAKPDSSVYLKRRVSDERMAFDLQKRYAAVAAYLTANNDIGREMFDMLISIIDDKTLDNRHKIWAARALSEVSSFTPYQREMIEKILKVNIWRLNYLKDMPTPNGVLGQAPTAQGTAATIHAYNLSFFAYSESDNALADSFKMLITTGTFSEQTFNLMPLSPGTRSDGRFEENDIGYAHNLLSEMTTALISLYARENNIAEIFNFIKDCTALTNDKKNFRYYILPAMFAIETAKQILAYEDLEGRWESEYKELAEHIYKNIKAVYGPALVIKISAQGAGEVIVEDILLGKIFSVAIKNVAKPTAKFAWKNTVKRFAPAFAERLVELTQKMSMKNIIKASKTSKINPFRKKIAA